MSEFSVDRTDENRIPAPLLDRMTEPSPAAIEQVRLFLVAYVADSEGMDEVRRHLSRLAARNRRAVWRDAEAIETLLETPQPAGTLSGMAAIYGNWVLEDETCDVLAGEWLRDIAILIREVIEESVDTVSDERTPRAGSAH
ncbi:hypothetical protein [Nocardia sp. NPDC050717]|uniref:hypothetical protein n=1 Tax=Nocardia sp. NPDC050717 TaxID=3157221 RepID=UPI0033F8D26A